MKKIFSLTCLVIIILLGRSAIAQQINHAEYFFDSDPGVGKGNAITITVADSIDFTGSVSTTGLNPGFHRLVIRVKNTAGKWSLYEARNFYINAPNNNTQPEITAAEYFFDNDPGLGLGTAVTVGTPGDSIDVNSSVSAIGLTAGFHRLCVRVKNSSGIWSLYEARNFYVNAPPNNSQPTIIMAECFFDNDPGIGKGKAVTVNVPGDSVDVNSGVSISGLKSGFHRLSVRVKNSSGLWSLYETRNFYIDTVIASTSHDTIVNGETYFDTDPGYGKGMAISPSFVPAIDSIDLNRSAIATGLPQGNHIMFIRLLDSRGNWSASAEANFNVCNHPPVAQFGVSNNGLLATFSNQSQNAIGYHWDFGDHDTSNIPNPTHTYASYATYIIKLTITDSCGNNSISDTFDVKNNTGINTVSSPLNGVSIYPNPNEGNFILGYHLTTPNSIFQVKDILGRDVYTENIEGLSGTKYINVSLLSSGLFYWQIVSGSQVLTNGKIVITR